MSDDPFAAMSPAMRRLATFPLPIRRAIFWLMWHYGWLIGRSKTIRAYRSDFLRYLGVPLRHLGSLERRLTFHYTFCVFELATFLGRKTQGLIEDLRHVDIENAEALKKLSQDDRSVIFAPLHMGSNVFAMVVLIYLHFRGRNILILRKGAREVESYIFQRVKDIGSEVRFMFVDDKASFVEALRFARRKAVIICFCDLPPHFGSPESVELLGRPARMAMGIEALARAVDAPIVPLTIFSRMSCEKVIVGKPFEVGSSAPAERLRVARRIADHVTNAIRLAPEQWQLWCILNRFLDELAKPEDGEGSGRPQADHPYAMAAE